MSSTPNTRTQKPTLVYSIAILAFLFGLALAWSTALGGGWWWDTAGALGFVALAYFVLLNAATGQGNRLSSHRFLGWCAVTLSMVHAALYLVTDSVVIEHLKLSAPPAMLVGILTFVIAVAGATLSLSRWKLKAHGSRENFQRYHRLMSWTVLVGCLYHVAATGHSIYRAEQFVLLAASTLLFVVFAKKITTSIQPRLPLLGILLGSLLALGAFVGLRNV